MVIGKKYAFSVAFRCDASKSIGSGHVMRCLTLADLLEARGADVTFLCTDETLNTVKLLNDSHYKKQSPSYVDDFDWLVVDHYRLDVDNYERASRLWAKNILVIDDLANRRHDCDVLVDMTYGRSASDYAALVPADCMVLAGAEFAILRPDFSCIKVDKIKRSFKAANRVLVFYGGVNPKRATERTLEMLRRYNGRNLEISVVTGGHAQGLDSILTLVELINSDKLHKAELHVDIPNIANLMAYAQMCLGAGGTASWERCCLGLPTLAIEVANNQAKVLKELHDAGAIRSLGPIEMLDSDQFLEEFSRLIEDEGALGVASQRAREICDGMGGSRVAACLLPRLLSKDGVRVFLRRAEAGDIHDVFLWQNEPGARVYARSPEIPTWPEHEAWYSKSLNMPDREMFIVLYGGRKAGILRLDRESPESHEVSILISQEFQGKGLGVVALKLLRSYAPFATFRAEILPANTVSHNIFRAAGYQFVNDGWYISQPT